MSIMEKNLPVATELASGDMVRIVTGGGNSKIIDADEVGKEIFVVNVTYAGGATSKDKSYNEIKSAYDDGKLIVCKFYLLSGIDLTMPYVVEVFFMEYDSMMGNFATQTPSYVFGQDNAIINLHQIVVSSDDSVSHTHRQCNIQYSN